MFYDTYVFDHDVEYCENCDSKLGEIEKNDSFSKYNYYEYRLCRHCGSTHVINYESKFSRSKR